MRRTLVGWAFVCIVAWLVLGGMAEAEEAECRANGGFLCFESGVSMIVVGILAILLWLSVAALITVAWKLTRRRRRQSRPPSSDPT